MTKSDLDSLRLELSVKAKNGINFILSGAIVWGIISYVWTIPISSYNKGVLAFIVGGLMLPLALGFSKLFKTQWKIKDNPIQPLGMWLNLAQLFYFPFLLFILFRDADYFIMTYAIITGAHFFPYAWFYNEKAYAIIAGIISIGVLLMSLFISKENFFLIGIFMSASLSVLAVLIYISYTLKVKRINKN